jgi:hypothetical protein
MKKEELINFCNDSRSPDSLRSVLVSARNQLENGKVSMIEMSPKPLSAQHYIEIYNSRLERAKRIGVVPKGLVETTLLFNSLEKGAGLYAVATIVDERPIYFWVDEESVVVGCVIG